VSILPDARSALIAGGFSYSTGGCVSSADIFDEASGRFQPLKSHLTYPRDFAAASPLPNGDILIAGGYNTELGTLATAEVFRSASHEFELLDSRMTAGRELFTATALLNGDILITGGFNIARRQTQTSADLFDPGSMTFKPLDSRMKHSRFGHAAVLLQDGRVLIVGGKAWRVGHPDKPLASAEIYDPKTQTFSETANEMSAPRDRPTLAQSKDRKVYVIGGANGAGGVKAIDEFNPLTNAFRDSGLCLTDDRMAHGQFVLSDDRIAVAGGWSPSQKTTTGSVAILDFPHSLVSSGPPLPESCHDMACVAFADGALLSAGGKTIKNGVESSLDTGYFWLP
jgi:hypothetical protein